MIEMLARAYEEKLLTMLISAFLDSKGLNIDELEKLPREEQHGLITELAQLSVDFINAQCEKAKGGVLNG